MRCWKVWALVGIPPGKISILPLRNRDGRWGRGADLPFDSCAIGNGLCCFQRGLSCWPFLFTSAI